MLIIDDDAPLAQFLTRLFSDDAQIETACNGSEGLEKVKEKYFDVIISDMQMPVMDGMEFYRRAAAYDPLIGQRTLFFTGTTKPEVAEFFRKNSLRYLMKPAGIREIVKKVAEIMPDVDKES
jgi:CheY-like chemotaxis protein